LGHSSKGGRQSGQPFLLRDISNGGSDCAEDASSGNPLPNPAVAFFDNTCEAGMMCGIAENRVPEWRATSRCAKILGTNGSSTRVLGFFGVFFAAGHVEPAGILLKLR